mmetsp:Transcript_3469/g.6079  ORF Transcript_3469/g.6079 Transcript_3469/m.6079 type:complete len:381 (-) Transcript_3469:150-1292(-)
MEGKIVFREQKRVGKGVWVCKSMGSTSSRERSIDTSEDFEQDNVVTHSRSHEVVATRDNTMNQQGKSFARKSSRISDGTSIDSIADQHLFTEFEDIISDDIIEYYSQVTIKDSNLTSASYMQLERERVKDILQRYIVVPSISSGNRRTLIDCGCGNGHYGAWLGRRYPTLDIIMLDPVRKCVELAEALVLENNLENQARVVLGSATTLPRISNSVDYILMDGPLYHISTRNGRRTALVEAYRVLCKGGILFAVGMSRYAFTLAALFGDLMNDDEQICSLFEELESGQHTNSSNDPGAFTSAFVHRPSQLQQELTDVGFEILSTLAVEGPVWLLHDLKEFWNDPRKKALLFQIIRRIETEPSLLGSSAHFLIVARRPYSSN